MIMKNNILKVFAALIAGCAMLASCQPEGTENGGSDVTPVFPEITDETVDPGEEVELSVTGNMDWTVSVPEESLQWFWIQDGSFKVDKISGKADEAVVVVIGVSTTEEFETARECEVTMTMGEESKVIARLVRPAKTKSLKVYAAEVTDGEIQFTEDGSSYKYLEEPESMELVWGGMDFRLPIKVEANFNWTYEGPEWLKIDVPEEGTGVHEMNIYGEPSEYPLTEQSGTLVFMSGDEKVKECVVKIPGCEDIFSSKVDMGMTEIEFSFKGQVKAATGYVDGPVTGVFSGTAGVRMFAVSKTEEGYTTAAPSWLDVTYEAYDETEGAPVLQERSFTISAGLNEGEDRYAAVFILSPVVTVSAEELFDGNEVKEEYLQYMIPVVQHTSNQEFVQMLSDASVMAEGGATFSVSEDESLYTMFGETRYAYGLVYTNQYARDNARMIFSSAVTSVKVFDEPGVEASAKGFLSITLDEDKLGGVIDMVSETQAEGYVVFYGATDNVLAVIKCTYDPETVIGEVSDVAFIGECAMYASMVGATLEFCEDGKVDGVNHRQSTEQVYHLRYTQEGIPMRISVPNSAVMHTVNPYTLRENIKVNDVMYENVVGNTAGGFELIDGGIDIYMHMPEGRNYMRGKIIFMKGSDEYVLTLVCTLDLRESAE